MTMSSAIMAPPGSIPWHRVELFCTEQNPDQLSIVIRAGDRERFGPLIFNYEFTDKHPLCAYHNYTFLKNRAAKFPHQVYFDLASFKIKISIGSFGPSTLAAFVNSTLVTPV